MVDSRSFDGTSKGIEAKTVQQEISDNQLYDKNVFKAIAFFSTKNYKLSVI